MMPGLVTRRSRRVGSHHRIGVPVGVPVAGCPPGWLRREENAGLSARPSAQARPLAAGSGLLEKFPRVRSRPIQPLPPRSEIGRCSRPPNGGPGRPGAGVG